MARERIRVPFGYEPMEDGIKGTLFVLEDFETSTHIDIQRIFELADKRTFEKEYLRIKNEGKTSFRYIVVNRIISKIGTKIYKEHLIKFKIRYF